MNVHFSSKSIEWETPQDFFDKLNQEFNLNCDVCANSENAKLPKFFDKASNGLLKSWEGLRCWMNPPYGREIGAWVEKALRGGRVLWSHYYQLGRIQDGFMIAYMAKQKYVLFGAD